MKKILIAISLTIIFIYSVETRRKQAADMAETAKWRRLIKLHDQELEKAKMIDNWLEQGPEEDFYE